MPVSYTTAIKTARMTATRDYHANGTVEILTAADAVLATFGLDAAGGTVAGAVWTLVLDAATVTATATGTGTAAKAHVKTAGGTIGLSGLTVGTIGTDIILDNTNTATGQTVGLSSAAITHA